MAKAGNPDDQTGRSLNCWKTRGIFYNFGLELAQVEKFSGTQENL